jgi:hypothetical protein
MRALFFLSKTLQSLGASLVRLTIRLLTDISGDHGSMRHCLALPQTHGTEVNRGGWLIPNKNSKVEAQTYENNQEVSELTIPH